MKSIGVIPVFYHTDVNTILKAIRVAYRCGARVFEFLHQRDNRGLRFFSWLVEQSGDMPDLRLGVGTVLDATMTSRYIEAGAQFIASPFLRKDMADICVKADILWIPGCSTVFDIKQAQEFGAKAVMLLPGNVLGPEFLRKAAIEFSTLSFVPSGGIDISEPSLRSWIHAGAISVRLGDSLFDREAIAKGEWDRIENNFFHAFTIIQKLKTPGKKNSSSYIV